MSGTDPRLMELELEDLKVHVAAEHERYRHLDLSIQRVEKLIDKHAIETKEQISEVKKILTWSATTLFGTMMIAMITTAFKML